MVNVGDKFIVEVEKIWGRPDGKKIYFMKGFNTLIFDDNGINRLEKYDPKPRKAKKDALVLKVGDAIHYPGCTTTYIVVGYNEKADEKWFEVFNTKTCKTSYISPVDISKWVKEDPPSIHFSDEEW